jgi:hypothetical protein
MDTLGVPVCYVAVLNRHLNFAEYVVHYDAEEAALLRDAGEAFVTSIARDEQPSIDGHTETYTALRHMHPDIDGTDVDLTEDLARQFCEARAALAVAEMDDQLARNRVAAVMGDARRARFNRKTIATRQAKGDGKPYLVAGRRLPTFPEKAA